MLNVRGFVCLFVWKSDVSSSHFLGSEVSGVDCNSDSHNLEPSNIAERSWGGSKSIILKIKLIKDIT